MILNDHTDTLLEIRPEAPLERGVTYELADSTSSGRVRFSPTGSPAVDAFTSLSVVLDAQAASVGERFECKRATYPSVGTCGIVGDPTLSFTSSVLSVPVLSVTSDPRDGFLVASYEGQVQPQSEPRRDTFSSLVVELTGSGEHCIVVEALSLRSGERTHQQVCRPSTTESEDARTSAAAIPDLGLCTAPPQSEDSDLMEPSFLAQWCRDRAAYCSTLATPNLCADWPDARCAQTSSQVAADAVAQGGAAPSLDADASSTDEPQSGGCSVAGGGSVGGQGLLLA